MKANDAVFIEQYGATWSAQLGRECRALIISCFTASRLSRRKMTEGGGVGRSDHAALLLPPVSLSTTYIEARMMDKMGVESFQRAGLQSPLHGSTWIPE